MNYEKQIEAVKYLPMIGYSNIESFGRTLEKRLGIKVIIRDYRGIKGLHIDQVARTVARYLQIRIFAKQKTLKMFLLFARPDISLSSPVVWDYVYEGDDDSPEAIQKRFEAMGESANVISEAAW